MQKMYNGEMMRVLRSFTFNGEQYVDLRNQAGEDFESVPVEDLGKKKAIKKKAVVEKRVPRIRFSKGDEEYSFWLDSNEYEKFVADNKLNKAMIQNCLEGVVKTHKGYKISEVK
ncbi:hypothetical protein [Limosilactobacillus reuteri]|uniref:hypothetical protein n=1 Tax=Limosilactobacillus reuteri TaxID=1598 RepID=UPI001E4B8476|nr:hypothetical protein [Limosilactobacillus reuteri]MCC4389203.1 hypothetical protein [Limosilactobacillus reuteri]MCC4427870.1 hypothetical protein [Limosilactobacillus reuteri]MCC4431604.1 hypothetical protein [Limosilactobacillus reuteri]MCC4433879.1 hypothetical protein [Limosilactobacillus reuteri]